MNNHHDITKKERQFYLLSMLSVLSVLSMLSVLSVLSMLSVFSVLSMLSVFPVLSMLSVYLLMLRLMLRLMLLLLMLRLMLMLLMCLLLMLKLQSKYSVYTEHYDVFCKFIMVSFLIIIAYRFSSPMRKIHMRELKSEPHGLRVSTIHHHHILSQKYSHICCYLNMLLLQPEALYSFQCHCLGNIFPQDKYTYLK